MEMPVRKKLRALQVGGKIILTPNVPRSAGEHGLGLSSMAARFARQSQDALQIGVGAVLPAFALQGALDFPRQVFDENCIFLMRLVAGCRSLKIKSECAGFFIPKFCQFSDLFSS